MHHVHIVPTTHASMPAIASSFQIIERPSFVAAPVADTGPPVDVLVGDSPSPFAFVGAEEVVPVGKLVATAPVPFEAPKVGIAVPFSGIGTFGVGNDPPATVCKPV